ncbi:predicted protein [Chaetoceros tenuissimus]|uniref:Uncharacterized protein n=2 Tax=Chaetoceros tenuissimus TaxID=426638 RepID=A0AAD3H9N6_9STRA|nr:predicted protein [Chaetoceros tenuissimus]
MYAPEEENLHTPYFEHQRRMAPSCNRFYQGCGSDESWRTHTSIQQQLQVTNNKSTTRSSFLYNTSQPGGVHSSWTRGEQDSPAWRPNIPVNTSFQNGNSGTGECDPEYIMRTTLIRLLDASKRATYTRQCLKQRFSAEKRRILRKRNRYTSKHNAAILHVEANYPKFQERNSSTWASCESGTGRKNEWQSYDHHSTNEEKFNHKREGRFYTMIPDNAERDYNVNTRVEGGALRRFSMTMVQNEEPSFIQKEGFEW